MPKKRDMSSFFKQVSDAAPKSRDENGKKDFTIENLFTPTYKDGKTEVVMRFLPPNVNEFKPFVANWLHIQKGFGCDCLAKFGKKCPICEHNHALWKKYPKTASKEEQQIRNSKLIVREKKLFYTNVLIVRNDNNPETEGKVFRYCFGPKIMGMMNKVMAGYEDSEEGWQEGINPYDWTEGANFTLKGVMAEYGPNYDDSKFGKQKAINRYDRATKTYIPLDTVEQDAIEAQLYTLDEIDKKEEECMPPEKVVEYCERKFKFKLWKLGEDGKPVIPEEETADNTADNPYSKSVKETPVDDFAADFESTTITESKATDIEATASTDDSSFFDEIENM